jgi:hypothetical protein
MKRCGDNGLSAFDVRAYAAQLFAFSFAIYGFAFWGNLKVSHIMRFESSAQPDEYG